ncbi:hypothetical protein FGO68_gene2402 [Halteria grandinella]|uniref:Uncharacterized protein n=1 Tax=Halteria grandinella TaxID=5974 RepID=A0A8J8T6M1_HALGN|nr:hypothetical protein FGO68_gene2402 [Halteria grandinella]
MSSYYKYILHYYSRTIIRIKAMEHPSAINDASTASGSTQQSMGRGGIRGRGRGRGGAGYAVDQIRVQPQPCKYNLSCRQFQCKFMHSTADGKSPVPAQNFDFQASHNFARQSFSNFAPETFQVRVDGKFINPVPTPIKQSSIDTKLMEKQNEKSEANNPIVEQPPLVDQILQSSGRAIQLRPTLLQDRELAKKIEEAKNEAKKKEKAKLARKLEQFKNSEETHQQHSEQVPIPLKVPPKKADELIKQFTKLNKEIFTGSGSLKITKVEQDDGALSININGPMREIALIRQQAQELAELFKRDLGHEAQNLQVKDASEVPNWVGFKKDDITVSLQNLDVLIELKKSLHQQRPHLITQVINGIEMAFTLQEINNQLMITLSGTHQREDASKSDFPIQRQAESIIPDHKKDDAGEVKVQPKKRGKNLEKPQKERIEFKNQALGICVNLMSSELNLVAKRLGIIIKLRPTVLKFSGQPGVIQQAHQELQKLLDSLERNIEICNTRDKELVLILMQMKAEGTFKSQYKVFVEILNKYVINYIIGYQIRKNGEANNEVNTNYTVGVQSLPRQSFQWVNRFKL